MGKECYRSLDSCGRNGWGMRSTSWPSPQLAFFITWLAGNKWSSKPGVCPARKRWEKGGLKKREEQVVPPLGLPEN